MLHLQLVTLSGIKFEGDVYEVVLPTLDGEIGVLSNHMPLISVATAGAVAGKANRTATANAPAARLITPG